MKILTVSENTLICFTWLHNGCEENEQGDGLEMNRQNYLDEIARESLSKELQFPDSSVGEAEVPEGQDIYMLIP